MDEVKAVRENWFCVADYLKGTIRKGKKYNIQQYIVDRESLRC